MEEENKKQILTDIFGSEIEIQSDLEEKLSNLVIDDDKQHLFDSLEGGDVGLDIRLKEIGDKYRVSIKRDGMEIEVESKSDEE